MKTKTTTREKWHGTTGGYKYHKCKCDDCKQAIAEWMKRARERRRKAQNFSGSKHGTRSCYINGCRCKLCKAANSEYVCAWNKTAKDKAASLRPIG